MRIWRLMAEYDGEGTTYVDAAGSPASPFTPDFDGQLVGLRTVTSQGAATTLTEHGVFRLSVAYWPSIMEVGFQGNGLMTAPAIGREHLDYQCQLPVKSGIPIKIEAKNITAATPVTNEVFLYGCFEIGGR